MKKVFSWIFFVLTIFVFAFDLYFAISGTIDVQKNLDKLAATPGASGVDYLGVGADVLVFGVIAISILGFIFSIISIISCKISQNRVMSIMSYIALACFSLPILFLLACFIF